MEERQFCRNGKLSGVTWQEVVEKEGVADEPGKASVVRC